MKVYRGYNKEIGPISYPDWIYVTQDLEQAKYYATRNGAVEDGAIIEYNMADDLKFISIDYVNKIMDNGDPYNQEYYTEEDLLWYQDGLADYLYRYGAGIKFEDPEYEGHIIYILFNEKYLTDGRILSKEEFDKIQIKESVYENELNDVLKRAGIQLDESVKAVNKDYADTKLVTSAYELNEILKRNRESRVVYDKEKNFFLVANSETSIHVEMINDALVDGIYPPFEWNGHTICGNEGDGGIMYQINPKRFVLFRTTSDYLNGEDFYYDRYQYCYWYRDYFVFTRDIDFEETPLYKLLGEPLDIENIGNVLEDEGLNESVNKDMKVIAYHGSQYNDMKFYENHAFYLTDNYELAKEFATKEGDGGLYDGEIATVYTCELTIRNPYETHTEEEYDNYFVDTQFDRDYWIKKGYDAIIIHPTEVSQTTYYIMLKPEESVKILKKEVFTELDESVVDAMDVNGYTTYMYKNPTMKELRDDKEANGEFRVVRVNDDFFFGDAGYWIHDYMDESDDAIRLFYNLNTNTFYQDFETISDEEYNEFYQNFVESMQEPYILNTFPNCKFKLFSKTKVDNDTPFGLSESIFWRGERINNYEQHHYPWPEENKGYDPEDEMTVWKNPSAEWMKYQIDSGKYFRFTYITTEDTLFVWYGDDAFHTDTMDIAGVDGDVVGTMGKGFIDYWPDDDDSPELGDRLFREKRAKFLDVIYPNGYDTGVQY